LHISSERWKRFFEGHCRPAKLGTLSAVKPLAQIPSNK
jgi:hypothetical protein